MSNSNQRIDALQARVSAALRDLPGVTALYLFGSRRTAPDDPFADLDLQLLSDDLPATRRVWPHALARVAPITLAWPITPAPDNTAFAILFEGESLYHKLDIGLSPASERAAYVAPDAPYTLLWEQQAPREEVVLPSTEVYLPPMDTVGYALFDDLLGSVRYLKARKRHQPLTCWRFIRPKPELLLRLLSEQHNGWQSDTPALSTWDYKGLDQQLGEQVRAQLFAHLDWATPVAMDAAFVWFTERIAALFEEKAATRAETPPLPLVAQHLAFLRNELATD